MDSAIVEMEVSVSVIIVTANPMKTISTIDMPTIIWVAIAVAVSTIMWVMEAVSTIIIVVAVPTIMWVVIVAMTTVVLVVVMTTMLLRCSTCKSYRDQHSRQSK